MADEIKYLGDGDVTQLTDLEKSLVVRAVGGSGGPVATMDNVGMFAVDWVIERVQAAIDGRRLTPKGVRVAAGVIVKLRPIRRDSIGGA